MKAPILATLSNFDYPHISIEQQQDDNGKPFYVGILWLDEDEDETETEG